MTQRSYRLLRGCNHLGAPERIASTLATGWRRVRANDFNGAWLHHEFRRARQGCGRERHFLRCTTVQANDVVLSGDFSSEGFLFVSRDLSLGDDSFPIKNAGVIMRALANWLTADGILRLA